MSTADQYQAAAEEIADNWPFGNYVGCINYIADILRRHFPAAKPDSVRTETIIAAIERDGIEGLIEVDVTDEELIAAFSKAEEVR